MPEDTKSALPQLAQPPWRTNGTFLWVTSDRERIRQIGEHLALDIPDGHLDAIPRADWEKILAFIVRAVNAHDAMLAALKQLLGEVEAAGFHEGGDFGWPTALKGARAAIALAEGGA